jgi:sugar phosphate isomerase/epimerase
MSGMKLGLYTDSVSDLGFVEALDLAVELGLATVEIATGGQSSAPHLQLDRLLEDQGERDRWRGAIAERGLRLEALNCSAFPLHPRIGPAHQEIIRKTMRLAALLGVDTLITQSGCPGDSDTARMPNWIVYRWPDENLEVLEWQWERAVGLWRDLARLAADCGVQKIAFELHPLNLAYNVPTLLRMREAVGPIIGANFDPSHLMWQGMDIDACILALGPAVQHVHIKDTRMNPAALALGGVLDTTAPRGPFDRPWAFRTPGYGHDALYWRGFLSALRAVGYDGPLSIENEDQLAPGVEGVRKAVAFLRSVEP